MPTNSSHPGSDVWRKSTRGAESGKAVAYTPVSSSSGRSAIPSCVRRWPMPRCGWRTSDEADRSGQLLPRRWSARCATRESSSSSATSVTGLVRCSSNPAERARCRSSACPYPETAISARRFPARRAPGGHRRSRPGRKADVDQRDVGPVGEDDREPGRSVGRRLQLVSYRSEVIAERLADVGVVLHQHDPKQRASWLGGLGASMVPAVRASERKPHRELAPPVATFAVRRHRSAMQLNQALDQREADAQAALRAIERRFACTNISKIRFEHLRRDADPLSVTRTTAVSRSADRDSSTEDPAGEYLIALTSKLLNHLLEATGSASTVRPACDRAKPTWIDLARAPAPPTGGSGARARRDRAGRASTPPSRR